MEFIGYAYNVKELKRILDDLPEYADIVVSTAEPKCDTPEVYYDEGHREVILK